MSTVAEPEERKQLELPGFEGRKTRQMEIQFGGGVVLEGWDESDVEWFKDCRYGREVSFVVTGFVTSRSFKGKKETVDGVVTGVGDPVNVAKIDVHSIARVSE
jgi:hypothetical protein